MGTNVPTTKEIIREVVRLTQPGDATNQQAQLTHIALRNQLATAGLTNVADAPLTHNTLRIIQSTVGRFRSNDALQYLAELEIPAPAPNVLQRVIAHAGSSLQKITTLLRPSTREEGVVRDAPIPQVNIDM